MINKNKILKYPEIFVFFSCGKSFLGTQIRVRNIHSKQAIGVRVIEVLLYVGNKGNKRETRDWHRSPVCFFCIPIHFWKEVFESKYIPITKTYLYNFDPPKPHFCLVKLGFTGVYIIFLISAQNIDFGYSLEPPRRGSSNEYPQSMF